MQQSYIDSCTVSAATHAPPTRHVWQQSREHFVTYTGSSCSCIGVAMKRPTTYHYRSADPGRRLHSPGAQGEFMALFAGSYICSSSRPE
eukprot:366167-Chlamydomonas_euryale.AAC.4